MKKPEILNLRAHGVPRNYAICWEGDGCRHHFWTKDLPSDEVLASGEPIDVPLYRNLPLDHPDAHRRAPIMLDTTRGYGKAVMPLILAELPRLMAEAQAREVAEEAERQRRARAARAEKRVRDAAPVLLEAAQAVIRAWEDGDLAAAVRSLSFAVQLATEEE